MIKVSVKGSFDETLTFLKSAKGGKNLRNILSSCAEEGLKRLRDATPKDSGYTAECWSYKIIEEKGQYSIVYTNSHVVDGQSVAILLQYGHATKSGGWVEGIDYINPALRPAFEQLAKSTWGEMTK